MKVITTATLEDTSIGALALVKATITTDGHKTHITLTGMGSKPRAALELTVDTDDILRAHSHEEQ